MNDYLTKPVNTENLSMTLQRWLPEQSQQYPRPCKAEEAKPAAESAMNQNVNFVFDREGLMKRIGGNEDLAHKLIEAFFAEMPLEIEQLRSAILAGNRSEARRLAHKIGGAAVNMGFENISSVARELEQLSKTETAETIDALARKTSELDEQFQLAHKTMLNLKQPILN